MAINASDTNGSDYKSCQVLVVRGKDRGKICGKPACTPVNETHVTIDCCGQHYRTEIMKPPEDYRKFEHKLSPSEIQQVPNDYLAFMMQ